MVAKVSGDTVLKEQKKEVLEEWVNSCGDALYAFALLRVGSRELAEDLVQETFMAAYAAFDSFQGRAAPRTWLTSILKNKIIDHLRKGSHEAEIVDPRVLEQERRQHFNVCGDWLQSQARWGKSPESALEEKGFFSQIMNCIEHLPQKLRTLFVMRVLDDEDTATICKNLSLSTSNM